MDRKRNILIRELMGLIDQAKDIQREIDTTFTSAYDALMQATIELGLDFIKDVSGSVAVDNGIRIKTRSVMGTEIPLVQYEQQPLDLVYAYYTTRESLDIARERFLKVKELTVRLSMIENAAYKIGRAHV